MKSFGRRIRFLEYKKARSLFPDNGQFAIGNNFGHPSVSQGVWFMVTCRSMTCGVDGRYWKQDCNTVIWVGENPRGELHLTRQGQSPVGMWPLGGGMWVIPMRSIGMVHQF